MGIRKRVRSGDRNGNNKAIILEKSSFGCTTGKRIEVAVLMLVIKKLTSVSLTSSCLTYQFCVSSLPSLLPPLEDPLH